MSTKVDRIANLLASGVTPTMVAMITGVSDSYISQLKSDPDFVTHVESLQAELLEESTDTAQETELYKDKLLGAEHKILAHIIDRLPYMTDGHAIAALAKVGERRDSIVKQQLITQATKTIGQGGATIRMVELTIPAISAPEIQLGKNNEIVAIGNRAISPMPTAALQKIIEGKTYEHSPLDDL